MLRLRPMTIISPITSLSAVTSFITKIYPKQTFNFTCNVHNAIAAGVAVKNCHQQESEELFVFRKLSSSAALVLIVVEPDYRCSRVSCLKVSIIAYTKNIIAFLRRKNKHIYVCSLQFYYIYFICVVIRITANMYVNSTIRVKHIKCRANV